MEIKRYKNYFSALTIAIIILLDQISKIYLQHRNFPIIKNLLEIKYAENPGIIFGIFPHNPFFLFVLPSLVIALVVYYLVKTKVSDYRQMIAYSLIIAGLAGNIIDRAFRGFVIDWLFVMIYPKYNISLFNIADASLVIGLILLIYFSARSENEKR